MLKNIFKFIFVISFLLLCFGFIQKGGEDLSVFLKSTNSIDSDNPKIIAKAKELTEGCKSDVEKAKALYEFVRDSYTIKRCESFIASETLECGGNFCHQRSILLAALCRAVGIPSRLHLQKVTLKRGDQEGSFAHSITGIYLKGNWHLYEPTGNSQKWAALTGEKERGSEMPIEFSPDHDCLFPQDEKVITETLTEYFADWTDEMIALIRKIDGSNKYV